MELDEIAIKNSGWIWSTLRDAKKLSYQIGEESITDFLVLNIKKWGKEKIIIDSFTRHKESINGSDWEWWFTGQSGKWLGMRIQAKVLNLNSEKYEHLHHTNKNGHQVDLLINDAKKHNLVPLYCMYTNWKLGDYKVNWQCKTYKPSILHYGSAILNPIKVKQLQQNNAKHLTDVIHDLRPMHCLFCCKGYSQGDLPERALKWLSGVGLLIDHDTLSLEHYIKDSPPYYITQMLEAGVQEDVLDLNDDRLKRVTIFNLVDD